MTFGLELPLLMGSLWVGHGLVIGMNYVDVVGVGWDFYVGWYAPPATLTELRFHSPGLRGAAPLPWVHVILIEATL